MTANALEGWASQTRRDLDCSCNTCFSLIDDDEPAKLPKEDHLDRIERDFAAFGTSLGEHPSKIIRENHWHYEVPRERLSPSIQLNKMIPNQMLLSLVWSCATKSSHRKGHGFPRWKMIKDLST